MMGLLRIVSLVGGLGVVVSACSGASSVQVGDPFRQGQDSGVVPLDATVDSTSEDGSVREPTDAATPDAMSDATIDPADAAADATNDDGAIDAGDASSTNDAAANDAGGDAGETFACGTAKCDVATQYCLIETPHAIPLDEA